MPETICNIKRNILADPKPVILVDTCALLDIVRAPEREYIAPEIISCAPNYISSSSIWFVASEIVCTEWRSNITDVTTGTRNAIRSLHNKAKLFKTALDHSSIVEKWDYSKEFTTYKLEEELTSLSESLLSSLILIENDEDCLVKASLRVVNGTAPASKGKDEYKDCMIIEHYLKLTSLLRADGFSHPVIFVTSNKSDFGPPYKIKEPLSAEFSNICLQYAPDLFDAQSKAI